MALTFEHEQHWLAEAQRTSSLPPTFVCERLLCDILPENIKNAVVVELGSGGGRDTLALAADPRVSVVYTFDALSKSAEMLRAVDAQIQAMTEVANGQEHFARIVPHVSMVEDLASSSIPAADIVYACSVMPYIQPDKIIPATAMLAESLKPGGIFIANYGGPGIEINPRMPPVTITDVAELETAIKATGCAVDIQPLSRVGDQVQTTPPGQVPLMYLIVAQKPALVAGS